MDNQVPFPLNDKKSACMIKVNIVIDDKNKQKMIEETLETITENEY